MKYTKQDLNSLKKNARLFNDSWDKLYGRCSDIMDVITSCFEVPNIDYLNFPYITDHIESAFNDSFITIEVGWCNSKRYSLATNNINYADSIPVEFLLMSSEDIRSIVMEEINVEEIEAAKAKLTKEERKLLGVA